MMPNEENESEINPASRKSSKIIDEAIRKLRTLQSVAEKKGTLKEVVVSAILKAQQSESPQAVYDLARYLEDDINIWPFSKEDEVSDEEIKRDALTYLHGILNPDVPRKANDPETIEPPDFDTP